MATHEGIENWREAEVLRTAQFVTGLYIVRDEIQTGTNAVEALVYAGNIASQDAVDAVYVFHLGQAAFRADLLNARRNRMIGLGELIGDIHALVGNEKIIPDRNNPATYFHPRYLQNIVWS